MTLLTFQMISVFNF